MQESMYMQRLPNQAFVIGTISEILTWHIAIFLFPPAHKESNTVHSDSVFRQLEKHNRKRSKLLPHSLSPTPTAAPWSPSRRERYGVYHSFDV